MCTYVLVCLACSLQAAAMQAHAAASAEELAALSADAAGLRDRLQCTTQDLEAERSAAQQVRPLTPFAGCHESLRASVHARSHDTSAKCRRLLRDRPAWPPRSSCESPPCSRTLGAML